MTTAKAREWFVAFEEQGKRWTAQARRERMRRTGAALDRFGKAAKATGAAFERSARALAAAFDGAFWAAGVPPRAEGSP